MIRDYSQILFTILCLVEFGLAGKCSVLIAQDGVDLFPDQPALASGYVRIGSWNVRHLKMTPEAEAFLHGNNINEDASILVASFAKAIHDLNLDMVLLIEVQPREAEPDRLADLVDRLNVRPNSRWQFAVTHIEYDRPDDPFGNLQFALVWNCAHGLSVDTEQARLLSDLRQPRDEAGVLIRRDQRIPWLVPISIDAGSVGKLHFDLLALHLKSGGGTPQAAEVDAVASFIRSHQSSAERRHLMVAGDWNIRPDEDTQGRGRPRLRKLTIPTSGGPLMRILTVGDIRPTLDEWERFDERIGGLEKFNPAAALLPASHFDSRQEGFDALLDHIAISRTMDELFDHPVEVQLDNGRFDLRQGIEIVRPLLNREKYLHFTDHLPIVVTLRIHNFKFPQGQKRVAIVAAEPNPIGNESMLEQVHLRNYSSITQQLEGWRLQNASGDSWRIGKTDQPTLRNTRLLPRRTVVIQRNGRPMQLSNSGDTISLFDDKGNLVDSKTYREAPSGERLRFE